MKKLFLILSALFMVSLQTQAAGETPELKAAQVVDLQQYLGRWYEVAAIPQSFETQCIGNTMAEYSMADQGLISIANTCDTANGTPNVATGRAKVIDGSANAKLNVTFVKFFGWQFLFGGDYWILAVGENYSYAVVSGSSREYAWILSRNPYMPFEQLNQAARVLKQQGFDTCKLFTTVQSSGIQQRTPLCEIVSGD